MDPARTSRLTIALDTETTGLGLRHGARPFFVSTWSPQGDDNPYKLPGTSRNWSWPIDPATRQPSLSNRGMLARLESLADYLEGCDLAVFNAGFDLLALATVGFYIEFDSVGGKPWSTTDLRDKSRPGYRDTLRAPLVLCRMGELHDVAVLAHARDNKRPKPPVGLKDTAMYYAMIPDDDESALRKATTAARRQSLYPTGIDHLGDPAPASDYWLSFQRNEGPLAEYASRDAYRTLYLFEMLSRLVRPGIKPQGPQDAPWHHYRRQMAVLPSTLVMASQGLPLRVQETDPKKPGSLAGRLLERYQSLKSDLDKLGRQITLRADFNSQSHDHLAGLLYNPRPEGLGLPLLALTTGGLPSIASVHTKALVSFLDDLEGDCLEPYGVHENGDWLDLRGRDYFVDSPAMRAIDIPLCRRVLDLLVTYSTEEGFSKNNVGYKSYYTGANYLRGYAALGIPPNEPRCQDAWRKDPFDRWPNRPLVVYPSFNVVGIALTRFSSRDPNGQNVSKKPEIPLRTAFGPPPGKVWAAIDYSQLELRLFAAASRDSELIRAFQEGYDFHTFTACGMYGYSLANADKIPSHLRRVAKNVNFGIIYGAGAPKIAATSGDPLAYYKYSTQFPGARRYMDNVIAGVEKTGAVRTLFGYRLFVRPDPPYKGVNYVVQGTAGELVKEAMKDLWSLPDSPLDWSRCRLVLNVHDELVFEIDDDDLLDDTVCRLKAIMAAQGEKIEVDTPVDAKIYRTSWGRS